MNAHGEHTLPAVAAWRPLYLRLIAFPTDPPIFKDQHWWQELTGGKPEISVNKKHTCEDKGEFKGDLLALSCDLNRITWNLTPPEEMDTIPEMPFALKSFPESIDHFTELMSRWLLDSCPPITRLGFATHLMQKADGWQKAYRLLQGYIPAVQIDDDATDVLFRINRKRDSSVMPGLRINRLSTWSVAQITVSSQVIGMPTKQKAPAEFFCSVELDINNDVGNDTEVLSHEALPKFFSELVRFGSELAAKGDVPKC